MPGQNLYTGISHFQNVFRNATSLEEDLLNVAAAIFAADLAFKRGERENVTRTIDLSIPVVNHAAFENIKPNLMYALYVLSHDAWRITFTARSGVPEEIVSEGGSSRGKVLLFSGGLDSLAAAVDLAEKNEKTQLVSHITGNRVIKNNQPVLYDALERASPGLFHKMTVPVGGRKKGPLSFPSDQERESSQRTRSFLFLALASLAARRCQIHEVIWIAENGLMAIHLPLTAGRISAFSTHTAHPEFVHLAEIIFSSLLRFQLKIENPFVYQTKSEVVKQVCARYPDLVRSTISCWKASRISGDKNHCGFCIPCLIRRIATEFHGLTINEFQRDLFVEELPRLPVDDDGKRNLVELGEFIAIFEKSTSVAELLASFPELQNDSFEMQRAIDMYRRFALEARKVFAGYSKISEILK